MPKSIYLDYASSTPVFEELITDMQTLNRTYYANGDALHDQGHEVASLVALSRQKVAQFFGVSKDEIYFTSGASESNNTAIKGIAFAMQDKGKHLITSQVEHPSVYEVFKQLENYFGFEVTYLPVNQQGIINIDDLKNAIKPTTTLVSLMAVNNETGAINPLEDIVACVKSYPKIMLHVDATQALAKIELPLYRIDALSFSAHKIHGVKGSGLLIKRNHVPCLPLIAGGKQERGLRGGTTVTVNDILWAKTLRLAQEHYQAQADRMRRLHLETIHTLEAIEGIAVNSTENGSPYIVNFSVLNVPSEIMMNALNQKNIYISAQSTCSFDGDKPSRVLAAMNYDLQRSMCSVRMSFSFETTEEEIKALIEAVKEIKNYVRH